MAGNQVSLFWPGWALNYVLQSDDHESGLRRLGQCHQRRAGYGRAIAEADQYQHILPSGRAKLNR